MSDRPNIVMIVAHDLGTHLGCYGASIDTPNIDAIAAEGIRFSDHHCTAAQCSPARGSLITGLYPHNNGLIGLAHLGWEFNEGVKTLPQLLRQAGYSTHLFGVEHETARTGDFAARLGYDEAFDVRGRAAEVAEDFAGWLGERSSADGPFFVSIGTREPHRKYPPQGSPGVDRPEEVEPLPWLPDLPGIRGDIGGLNALVRRFDEGVGIVREAIDAGGFAQNTLLIVTTDHGIAMPRAKCTCYDPGTRTALVMRLAGRWDGGAVYDELISGCDLLPTLMELVGAPVEHETDGRSYLELLDEWDYQPRDYLFTEMTYHSVYNPMRCIRTKSHKYIRNFGDLPLVHLPGDIFNSPSGEEMRDEYYGSARPSEELYDLDSDPWEQENLVGRAEHAEQLRWFSRRVEGWMEESGDALLKGRIAPNPVLLEHMRQRRESEEYAKWFEYSWPEQTWFLD